MFLKCYSYACCFKSHSSVLTQIFCTLLLLFVKYEYSKYSVYYQIKIISEVIFCNKEVLIFNNLESSLHEDYIIKIGGVLLADVFAFEVPRFVCSALDGYLYGVVAVLAVDGNKEAAEGRTATIKK